MIDSGYTENEIQSGDTSEISIEFSSESLGEFEKNILIDANTAPPFTVLTINGIVK